MTTAGVERRAGLRGAAAVAVLAALHVLVPAMIDGQAPARGPREGEVATDPIRCWWRTDRGAIRIGERFAITLTCGVIETGSIAVVPNVTQLDPGALGLTPFEVLGGRRHADLVAPPWRYVQFEYTARLLGDGFFGQDVHVPALTVTYNVQQRAGGPQGRDQSYVLPPLPMRVLSLVPRAATDIRDSTRDTFAGVEAARFRATAATVGAFILFAFSAALLLVGAVRASGGLLVRRRTAARIVPPAALLAGCQRALRTLRAESRGGWTPELARRALAALRIASAVAIGRQVAQSRAARGAVEREGQVRIRYGLLGRRQAFVSAAATPQTIAVQLGNGGGPGPSMRATLHRLQDTLQTFSAAGYARNGRLDGPALDAALEEAAEAIRRVRAARRLPRRLAAAVGGQAWPPAAEGAGPPH